MLEQTIPQRWRVKIDLVIRLVAFAVSLIAAGSVVVNFGFELPAEERRWVTGIVNASWWFYFVMFTLQSLWALLTSRKNVLPLTIAVGMLLYVSALPRIFGVGEGSLLHGVWTFLGSGFVTMSVVSIFAVLDISRAIVGLMNRKTNPAMMLAGGFAIIIVVGALLLMLPRSLADGAHISVVDAFFVSTSAVCVTGLSPVDISTTFSIEGQIVLLALMQIGGLGVMTITSFFALFYMGNTAAYSQLAMRDMVGSDTWNSLVSTLFYILGFTFVIEMIGALLIWTSIHGATAMTVNQEIYFSVFHSISAFCNAGFSTDSQNLGNAVLMSCSSFYVVISMLVILGGIGFPILVNFRAWLAYRLHSIFKPNHRKKMKHIANLNTRIVITTTVCLLVLGTAAIAVTEWNGAFAELSLTDKVIQSFFYSVVPRTAGFSSVDMSLFSTTTLVVVVLLMWIGGASQSTAGGIKVNTVAVAAANFLSVIRGRGAVVLFNREVSADSVRRAMATIFASISAILIAFLIMLSTEPDLPAKGLLFEIVSAASTVGLSVGVTPQLSVVGKVVISVLMFCGRVGFIVLGMSLVRHRGEARFRYPKDNIIIN
ncbi:MAG: potassium transporter TrkG [Bacteroidales bacterium]|nr:potassium transporter TrkG [Bacteroidales bacterium]